MSYTTRRFPDLERQLLRRDVHLVLWILGALAYGVGDVVTTTVFVGQGLAAEGNPIVAAVFEHVGVWALVPWKVASLAGFVALYRIAPREWRVGVPIGLVLLGSGVTLWNLSVGLRALGV